uniref:BED-type domain-containing protein n=1 Tax=Timema douglasi TaxID=61478 RepID=A0A7R8Z5H1_TIMDO|nr:unnamed protein product [Timema douglasi]
MEKPKEVDVKVDGRRKRSKVWAYFEEGNGDATCMHCSKKLKRPTGTTSTLKNHLSRHHITLYEEFLKLDAVSKDASLASTSALKSSPKQQTLISMVKKKEELPPQGKEAKAISDKIAQMLALCHLPYQFVEERGFKELMAHIKPNYRIPVSTTFSRNIVPLLYQSEKKMLASVLSEDIVAAQLNTISLTTDNWTSRAGDGYASLTCHYSRDFKYKSFTLANVVVLESHTAVNIRHTLSEMCKDWCIPPPTQSSPIKVFIVTDNARNLQAAINGTYWIRRQCFAHTLQLAIKDAKTACPNITQIISKSRAIVGHYSRSSTANARLHAVQKTMDLPALKLIQDVETRWSSEYAMLDRLVCLRKAVAAELASSNSDIDSLSSTEWKLAGGIVEVMRPFAEATTEACGNAYPTASMIIPILHCLEATTLAHIQKNELVSAVPFARSLLKSLKSRFALYKMDEINALCTIVDPRYKAALFNEEERFHAINLLRQELLSYVAPETQANKTPKTAVLTGSMWDELDKITIDVLIVVAACTNTFHPLRNGRVVRIFCGTGGRRYSTALAINVGIIGLVVGYTITGAFIFIFIEKKEVSEGNIIVMKLRNETVDFLWNLTYVLNVFDEPHWKTAVSLKLMDYQEEVVKAISKGFDGSDNNLGGSQWSFSGAFLYSLTVITTIGLALRHSSQMLPYLLTS